MKIIITYKKQFASINITRDFTKLEYNCGNGHKADILTIWNNELSISIDMRYIKNIEIK